MELYRIKEADILNNLLNLKQITFEVTTRCNLKCKYCCYGDLYDMSHNLTSENLTFSKAKLLLDYIFELWQKGNSSNKENLTFISFYGGEPLMNFGLIEQIIKYVEDQCPPNRKVRFSMTTNGVLLDTYINYLVEKDVLLLVSLDGDKKGNNFRLTSTDYSFFDKILETLKEIKKNYNSYFNRNIEFNCVLHKENNVYDIITFFNKQFAKQPIITELCTDNIKKGKEKEFQDLYRSYKQDISNDKRNDLYFPNAEEEEVLIFLEKHSGNYYKGFNELIQIRGDECIYHTGTCLPFAKKIFLTAEGKILPCERISSKYFLGEVMDAYIELDLPFIVKKINRYLDKIKKMCESCARVKDCVQCIYKIEGLDEKYFHCALFCNKTEYDKDVKRNMTYLRDHPFLYKKLIK